jgi:DNA-binding NtrC family response regulator
MPDKQAQSPVNETIAVKSILVVEDDSDIGLFLIQAISQETPHQALLVTDGFQALKAITNLKPDLFILDYWLPSMNGLELYDKIHATNGLEHIPTIMISAQLPKRELQKRAIHSLNKPLELDEFLRLIERLLGGWA